MLVDEDEGGRAQLLEGPLPIQVWAQAAEKARSLQLDAMISTLRHERFDTVIGRIGFDAKGDLTGIEPFVFFVWKAGENRPTDAVKTTTQ